MPSAAAGAPAWAPASMPSSPSIAETDQRADLGTELERLVVRQVAEVLDLELALGVLVDGQCVDHTDGVALAQPLELGDDLAVELGVLEAEHDQLDWSDRHIFCSPWSPNVHDPAAARIVPFGG